MLKRKSGSETQAAALTAVVAFKTTEAADELRPQLDQTFGKGAWSAASFDNAGRAIGGITDDGDGFVLVGAQSDEERDVRAAIDLIRTAKEQGRKVILLAGMLSPTSMHAMMRAGADDFTPLPVPAAMLRDAVGRLRMSSVVEGGRGGSRQGVVYPVYGAAGGVGATTLAVNLAWEMAKMLEKSGRKVALMDFNFQYGSVATYLDLPRREAIYELLSDTESMDEESFGQALTTYDKILSVLTAPMDALPLDIIGPEDVRTMMNLARANYDFIIIDLPQTLAHWSDLVLTEAEGFFAVMESDMRSAQNMLRFLRALQAEDLPADKVSVCLNRAPSFTDLSGKTHSRRLEESLSVEFAHRLPDGGKQVVAACDQGEPLAKGAKGSALRKEIRNIAQDIIKTADAVKEADRF